MPFLPWVPTAGSITLPLPIADGGTGQTAANPAFAALAPLTTAGDLLIENATPAPARLAVGSGSQVLGVSGGLPAWVAAATGTVTSVTAGDTSIVVGGTSTAPTVETGTLDVIATDHPPAANWSNNSHKITSLANGSGAQDAAAFGQIPTSAGSIGGLLAANNLSDVASAPTSRTNLGLGAVATEAYISGQLLRAPTVYTTSNTFTTTSTTYAAVSSGNAATGSFTAPASGEVLVLASVVAKSSSAQFGGFALAASGTVTPIVGNGVQYGLTATYAVANLWFPVTGLTSGNTYNFDLLFAINGAATMSVLVSPLTSTSITNNAGGPITMFVLAV